MTSNDRDLMRAFLENLGEKLQKSNTNLKCWIESDIEFFIRLASDSDFFIDGVIGSHNMIDGSPVFPGDVLVVYSKAHNKIYNLYTIADPTIENKIFEDLISTS